MKKFLAIVAVTAFLVSAAPSVWAGGEGCEHGCKDKDKAAAKEKDKGATTPTAGAEKAKEDGQKS